MDKRSYTGVSRDDIAKLRGGLGRFGIVVPEGDDVEIKGPLGVKMHVRFDEPTGTLELSIVERPAYLTEAQIWNVIESTAGINDLRTAE